MAMSITLRYFAQFRELFDRHEEQLDLPDDIITVKDLVDLLCARGGVWQEQLGGDKAFRVALNQEMVDTGATLSANAEVALFKPVTGG